MEDIVEFVLTLRERAIAAKEEGNATAQADAWYFEQAASRIEADAAEIARLTAEVERLGNALEVDTWTDDEREGMNEAFNKASERHGHYETLFAVAAWILKFRRARAALKGA